MTARYKQKCSAGSLAACPGRKRAARLQAAIVAPADGADRALVQAGRRFSPVSRVTGSTAGTKELITAACTGPLLGGS